jgi:hypothetical protein
LRLLTVVTLRSKLVFSIRQVPLFIIIGNQNILFKRIAFHANMMKIINHLPGNAQGDQFDDMCIHICTYAYIYIYIYMSILFRAPHASIVEWQCGAHNGVPKLATHLKD